MEPPRKREAGGGKRWEKAEGINAQNPRTSMELKDQESKWKACWKLGGKFLSTTRSLMRLKAM